jgi:hypothetical protein
MQDNTQPSTANIAAACAILAGVTGYMLGQAKSLGLFGGSPIGTPLKRKEKVAEESGEEEESSDVDEEEEDDSVPADFKDVNEECKMVLVVRTDLGMTKGMAHVPVHSWAAQLTSSRQDWRAMRARDTGLLQTLPQAGPELDDTTAMGTARPDKGGTAGQERGGAGDSAGTGHQSWAGRTHHS